MKKLITTVILGCSLAIGSGCSQSGRRQTKDDKQEEYAQQLNSAQMQWPDITIVKMKKVDGIYQVPIEVNGTKMYFIFNAGASMASISATEAHLLYKQRTLGEDDILGTANFMDANGNISEGTVINLKYIKVGNRVLTNVRASVVHNLNAPLLLGQTVMKAFGKISIDNNNGEIIFE